MNKRLKKKMAKKAALVASINNGIPKGYAKVVDCGDNFYHGFDTGEIVEYVGEAHYGATTFVNKRGLEQVLYSRHFIMGDA